jgi:hypothetical protein
MTDETCGRVVDTPKHNRRTRFARPALAAGSAQSQLHSHAQNGGQVTIESVATRNCLKTGFTPLALNAREWILELGEML